MTCGYLYKNECYNEAPWLLFQCVWVMGGRDGSGIGSGRDERGQYYPRPHEGSPSLPPGRAILFLADGWLGAWGVEVFHSFYNPGVHIIQDSRNTEG